MQLNYSEKYLMLQSEVRAFIAKHGHLSPKPEGGDRNRAARRSAGSSCCASMGSSRATSRGSTAASAGRSMSWNRPSSPRVNTSAACPTRAGRR